jgi:RNA polymerase sigma-70 factor (ECF subfamily)
MRKAEVKLRDSPANRSDDGALLARIRDGDRDALRQLYQVYSRRLSRFLTRLTREPRLIEEIVNDTMLVVWQHAGEFRGDSQPSTWILGIAYRRALKALERDHTAARRSTAARESATTLHGPVIDALVASAELDDWLRAALEKLSPEHRLTLELAYFLGLSCEEIAKIAGCPEGTVKTRMFYARRQLRELLVTLASPGNPR